MKNYITVWFVGPSDLVSFPMILVKRNGKSKYHYNVSTASLNRLTKLVENNKARIWHDGWTVEIE